MESSKEQIEAQLCAYIDGELSDAERAEIERHLASNPQHKALIVELRRQSGLLQDLPRASAPLELNEALCGQLERSALLNPSEQENSHSSLSINRWPQITAVAAVLMLAIGLGVVVYYVLPPSGANTKGPLAVDSTKLHPMRDGYELGKDEKSAKQMNRSDSLESRNMGLASKKGIADKSAQAAPEFDPTAARSGEIKNGRLITAKEVEELRQRTNLSLHGGNAAFNLDNSSLCLVVSTSNTAAANSQVEEYFKTNRIQFMNYDESAAADGAARSDIRLQTAPERAKENGQGRTVAGEVGGGTASSALGTAVRGGAGGGGGRPERDLDAGGVPATLSTDAKNLERTQQEAEIKAKVAPEQTPATKTGIAPPAPAPAGAIARGQASKPGAFGGGVAGQEPAKPENETAKLDRNEAGGYRKAPAKNETLDREGAESQHTYGEKALSEQLAPKDELRDNPDTWEMKDRARRARVAGRIADDAIASNGVIIARMNRRQANELSAYLSREQGQRAELTTVNLSDASQNGVAEAGPKQPTGKDSFGASFARHSDAATAPVPKDPADAIAAIAPAAASANSPKAAESSHLDQRDRARESAPALNYGLATKPAEPLAKRVEDAKPATQPYSAASRSLHITYDPLDEPVDVFIVVKNDALPTVPQIQLGAPKAKAESTPAEDKK